MDRLRFGIIGVGGRGIWNARAVNDRPDVELVGVCDINPERLKLCEEEGLAGERFDDYRDLLDRELDAVCINTYNNVHAEQTIAAAQRGVHVYVEKPIALSVGDAEAMVEACRGLATVVNLSMRLMSEYRYLRQLVQEERWGRLLAVGATHPKASGLLCQGQAHPATLNPARWGPLLMHDGVHICEWLRWMGGEVTQVYAQTRTTGDDPENEELTSALTTHEGDVLGTLSYMTMPFMPMRQYVIGDQFSAWPDRDEQGEFIAVANESGQERVPIKPLPLTGDEAYVDEFVRAIRESRRPYGTMEDGLAGQRLVHAIHDSARAGVPVKL